MKKIICSIVLIIFASAICNGQTVKKDKAETSTIHKKEKGKPEVSIKVNKQYDNQGNLILFDSTYTSFYSSKKVDKTLMDSLVNAFKSPFTDEFPVVKDRYFKNLFFTDSLLEKDFFHDDFFLKRFELNHDYLKRLMLQMDSVKNNYFKTQALNLNRK